MNCRTITSGVISMLLTAVLFADANAVEGVVVIDGEAVPYEEFERMVAAKARQTFYHSSPGDEAVHREFRRQVADQLVDRKLRLREARRTGIRPDREYVDVELSKYEAQYAGTALWEEEGEQMLHRLRVHFEEESLLEELDAVLRRTPEPNEAEIRTYYEENIEKFTEPEQVHLSVILIGVPAWEDKTVWDAARNQAAAVILRIKEGESFADAARENSDDPTAANGGDMGFVHAGILSGEFQQVVSELERGEMAETPVTVLEGVVIVRLEGRRGSQVHSLEEVLERATGLWQRDSEAEAYEEALTRLRSASDIVFDDHYLEQLPN